MSTVKIRVVNAEQGHLNDYEFNAEKIIEGGFVSYRLNLDSNAPPIFLKEDEVVEL
jgi:hypothetical protein